MKRIGVPDVLVDHATPDQSYATLGLTSEQIADNILQAFFKKELAAVKYVGCVSKA